MPTKCIVVHLADDTRYRTRLQLSVDIAKRFDAHLNVVYATEPVDFPAGSIGRAISLEYLEEAAENAKAREAEIQKEVDSICRDHLRSWEWHTEQGDVERIVSRFAHLADLVVVEQATEEFFEDRVSLHMSDHLVISAGCPMLLVPNAWTGGAVGTRVLVAWKNSREAIGAVRGGLTFMSQADSVYVLAAPDDPHSETPGEDFARYLERHGIAAEVVGTSGSDGHDILEVAQARGCDLIVMGAYARSRLRELIFGGATNYIMNHTTVPVLMRH